MGNRVRIDEPISLKLAAPVPLTLHPAAVYLDSLGSGSVRTMRQSLDAIADPLADLLGYVSEALRIKFSKTKQTRRKTNEQL